MSQPLFDAFESFGTKQWKQLIQYDLKGSSYEDLLYTSPEDITIKPFYNQEDLPKKASEIMVANSWQIGHDIYVQHESVANRVAVKMLNEGVNAIRFTLARTQTNWSMLLKDIHPDTHLIIETPKLDIIETWDTLQKMEFKQVVFNNDCIAQLIQEGNWYQNTAEDFKTWLNNTKCLNYFTVDFRPYQNAGGHIIQQLTYGLCHALEYANRLESDKSFEVYFKVAVGSHYFLEIAKIRALIGTETLISTSMDLHGNVSERLAQHTDLITAYRMAPHEDALESKQRAVDNLIDRLVSGKGKPKYKAWIPVPILLPGEKTSTRIEPGKSLYAQIEPLTQKKGVIDAAIWIGYAWADEPRNHAAVMVTGDDDEEVSESAEFLAQKFWDVRNSFEFVAPTTTFEKSLNMALNSSKKPFIISDMGDNPTAGGAGDVTWTLRELLNNKVFKDSSGPSLIYASIPGPEMIIAAKKAGVGGTVSAKIGAQVDDRFAPPLMINGVVEAIYEGDVHAETEAVIRVGSIRIIVTKKRKPYHREKDFTQLGLAPRKSDILVVKIGYLVPELYDMRGDWVMALTPGGVDQDLFRLGHKRIKRPMFPLDKDMEDVNLKTRFIRASNALND